MDAVVRAPTTVACSLGMCVSVGVCVCVGCVCGFIEIFI